MNKLTGELDLAIDVLAGHTVGFLYRLEAHAARKPADDPYHGALVPRITGWPR